MNDTDLITDRVPLIDICPRCGQRMVRTIREHAILRTCLKDGYEAVDIDGASKLEFDRVIGMFRVSRSVRCGGR